MRSFVDWDSDVDYTATWRRPILQSLHWPAGLGRRIQPPSVRNSWFDDQRWCGVSVALDTEPPDDVRHHARRRYV